MAEIPEKIKADIPGFRPVYFRPEDFTSEESYVRLCKGSPYLKPKDFVDELMFQRYFLISCDLLEGTCLITGKERSGKSTFAYHLAYKRRELFGIKAVFNRKAKKSFGEFETVADIELKTMQDELNNLVAKIEALDIDDDEPLPSELQAELELLKCYRCSYTVDESYKEISKDHMTNRTRFYGQLVRQFGHLHTLFSFISPDPNDMAGRLIWERQTHHVRCRHEHGMCYYTIMVNSPKVRGLVKNMELNPSVWGEKLFNSYNLVGTEKLTFHN